MISRANKVVFVLFVSWLIPKGNNDEPDKMKRKGNWTYRVSDVSWGQNNNKSEKREKNEDQRKKRLNSWFDLVILILP